MGFSLVVFQLNLKLVNIDFRIQPLGFLKFFLLFIDTCLSHNTPLLFFFFSFALFMFLGFVFFNIFSLEALHLRGGREGLS